MISKSFSPRVFSGLLWCLMVILLIGAFGCRNDANNAQVNGPVILDKSSHATSHSAQAFEQVNLVANLSSYLPHNVDANLLNAWGIAVNPSGKIWISANHSGVSVIYDTGGNVQRPPVTIPSSESSSGGAPTGVIFNPTNVFVIPSTGETSKFIFAGEDGIISAWSSGSSAIVVADRSSFDAVYKGIALAWDGSHAFLYATNFKGGTVDVFDDHFQFISTKPFQDPGIPAGFAPFGIQNVSGNLFVTYAKQKGPDNEDDEAGPGNGYVDVYRPNGMLSHRFASEGTLNSPWGLAQVPDEGFGKFTNAILVGNFGDGRISAFDVKGKLLGQIGNGLGDPVTIQGLWALSFVGGDVEHEGGALNGSHDRGDSHEGDSHGDDDQGGDDHREDHSDHHDQDRGNHGLQRLYFTAGPNDENDGIFGYLQSLK